MMASSLRVRRLALAGAVLSALASTTLAAVPTDNPVASYYGGSNYTWTNTIAWSRTFDITAYGGSGNGTTDNLAAYNAARDAAAAAGGGVVYFPTGTYYFSDSIQLKNGIVLRGDTPSVTAATNTAYAPPSKLVFPKYVYDPTANGGTGTANATAFKTITTTDPNNDSSLGLVNLDINRAAISLGSTVQSARAKDHVIFGVRSNNVAAPDPGVPNSSQYPWQRFSYRFTHNIIDNVFRNALVANNRLNDATTDNFMVDIRDNNNVITQGYKVNTSGSTYVELGVTAGYTGRNYQFSYTDHYGIGVNRYGYGVTAGTPLEAPVLFRPGIDIRDNYVFGTMRVKVEAAGLGMNVQDNVLRDQDGKTFYVHPAGIKIASNSQTNENRAFDFAGWDVSITGNDYQVRRHNLNNTTYYSVDGEGILLQESNGTLLNGATIANNTGNAYIGIYKTKEIRDLTITGNTLTGDSQTSGQVYVVADTNSTPYPMYNVRIDSNTVNNGIIAKATRGGTNDIVSNNTGSGTLTWSDNVTLSNNTGLTLAAASATTPGYNPGPDVAFDALGYVQELAGATDVTLTVNASDPDGVAYVELYDLSTVTTKIGTISTGPYTFDLGTLAPGEYMYAAKAYDSLGASWVSTPIYLVVAAPEPASLSLLLAGAALLAWRRR